MNTSPTQSYVRYVISFDDMTLERASDWPDLIRIVEARVKPDRDRLRLDQASAKVLRNNWWRFQAHRPSLYVALRKMRRCLVTAKVTKHLCFSFQPTGYIYNEKLFACLMDSYSSFALLQSRLHTAWTRTMCSTLGETLNYSSSDAFSTFPFPQPDPRTILPELESIGEKLYETRARLMVDTDKGLTKTYNALKNPACDDARILELRTLHEEMDRAVLAAYGWSDIPVPAFCPITDEDKAALQAFEDEVIDRLFVLNAERAAQEKQAAAATAPAPKATRGRAKKADDGAAPKKPAAKGRKGTPAGQGQFDL